MLIISAIYCRLLFFLIPTNFRLCIFCKIVNFYCFRIPLTENDKSKSSILSPNRTYYGDICNIGHAFIAYCHDPDNLALQAYSVMGEPATCARDVLFYRWYAFLVRIVQNHKVLLAPYTKDQVICLKLYVLKIKPFYRLSFLNRFP